MSDLRCRHDVQAERASHVFYALVQRTAYGDMEAADRLQFLLNAFGPRA